MARTQSEDGSSPVAPGCNAWSPPIAHLFPVAHRRLLDKLALLSSGTGGFAVVRGERDGGLSWIVDEVRRTHDGPTLLGRASVATADVPMWPIREALADAGEDADHPLPATAPHPTFEDIHAATDAVLRVADRAPTLLLIEHIEHADVASLAALERIAEGCTTLPLVCVATLASTGMAPADELVDALLERDHAHCIDLPLVSPELIAALVADVLGGDAPDELTAFVVDQAAGLPQLAERIVNVARRRHIVVRERDRWTVAGPLANARPSELVSRTARALMSASPPERDLVIAASVLARPAELRLLAAAADCDLDSTLDHLKTCVERELLRWTGESVAVRNGIVRDVALAGLTARTSLEVLERLAAAASATGAAGLGFTRAVELLEQGGRTKEAARHRLRVASRACAIGDLAEAAREVDAAVVDDDPEMALTAAELRLEIAARGGARPEDAAARADRLVALAPDAHSAAMVAMARATASADPAAASAIAHRGVAIDGDGSTWAAVLAALDRPAERRLDALRSLDGALRGSPAALARRHRAAIALATEPNAAASLLEQAHADGTTDADLLEAQRCVALRSQIELLRTGSPRSLVREAIALCNRGDRTVGTALAVDASLALLWTDEPDRARALLDRAAAAVIGVAPEIERRAAAAREAIDAIVDTDRARPRDERAAALALLLRDDVPGALAAARRLAAGDVDAAGVVETQWQWLSQLTPLLARLAGSDVPATDDRWSWTAHARALRRLANAVDLGAEGRTTEARIAFADGDGALATAPQVQLLARRAVGELAVRDGWADRSVELVLRATLVATVQRGLPAIAARCRAILRSGGFPIPRFTDGDADVPVDLRATGLTLREMQVVELLVAGCSTADVASRLFISATTVKSHVANTMRKLGYSSRRALLEGMAALQT